MSDSTYDMKRKLLELKSEMLKDTPSMNKPVSTTSILGDSLSNDDLLISLLKNISSNQEKILIVLSEISNKIGSN
jgi:hypothetical protein